MAKEEIDRFLELDHFDRALWIASTPARYIVNMIGIWDKIAQDKATKDFNKNTRVISLYGQYDQDFCDRMLSALKQHTIYKNGVVNDLFSSYNKKKIGITFHIWC